MKKSVLITHACGHSDWHKYDDWKYRDRAKFRNYCSWLADMDCNACQARELNKQGAEEYLAELEGSPSAIVYGAKCRANLLNAIYAVVYGDYDRYMDDPAFRASDIAHELKKTYRKYKHAIGQITSASTFIKLSQQELEAVVAYLDKQIDEA